MITHEFEAKGGIIWMGPYTLLQASQLTFLFLFLEKPYFSQLSILVNKFEISSRATTQRQAEEREDSKERDRFLHCI